MKIVSRNINLENMGNTLTVQHIGEYIGDNKERLGTIAQLFKGNVMTAITDSLANVFYGENKSRRGFTPVKKGVIEWDIQTNEIPKVYFSAVSSLGTSTGGADRAVIIVYTDRKYYDPGDTFSVENGQMFRVIAPSTRITNEKWSLKVTLVSDAGATVADGNYLNVGKSSIYRSNYVPEMSSKGYTKYTSDTETHRNFMAQHRHDISWSMAYANTEDTYINTGKKKDDKDVYLKLKKKELMVYENFYLSRENNMLLGQSNHDINGKCLDQDASGQDIPMGDGVVKQVERYASRTMYSDVDTNVFEEIMEALTQKADDISGNTFGFAVNQRLWNHVQRAIKNDDRIKYSSDNMLYSMKDGGDIATGGTFVSYEFAGNKLVFMPSKALGDELRWKGKGYGIAINLTPDTISGHPGVANYTMEGGEIITGTLIGLGGKDGRSSGDMYSTITGGEYAITGYSTAVVANPYNAHVIEENIA